MFTDRQRKSLQERFTHSKDPVRAAMIAEAFCLLIHAFTYAPTEPESVPVPDPNPESLPSPTPDPATSDPGPQSIPSPAPGEDLQEVPEIGPEEAKRLVEVGVGTLKALAKLTEPYQIAWNETVTPENVARWRSEAQRILARRNNE